MSQFSRLVTESNNFKGKMLLSYNKKKQEKNLCCYESDRMLLRSQGYDELWHLKANIFPETRDCVNQR